MFIGDNFDVGSVVEGIGNKITGYVENIKSYTVSQINSEVEKFMEENGISNDKVKEVEDLVKEWSEIAINAKGEIDKSKISL